MASGWPPPPRLLALGALLLLVLVPLVTRSDDAPLEAADRGSGQSHRQPAGWAGLWGADAGVGRRVSGARAAQFAEKGQVSL